MKSFVTLILFYLPATIFAQKRDTLFYENFNGSSLNRSAWNVEVTGNTVNNEQQAYVDSAGIINISNGLLTIEAQYHPGYVSDKQNKYDFLSGRINTSGKFEFTYGTASARIKMSAGEGLWPAFWALGDGEWPDCGEIDMMENIGDSSWISNAMHGPGYFGNTPIAYRFYFPAGIDVTEWHIYSVKCTPDSMVFSMDGHVTYKVTKAMVEHYGRWAYDNPKFIILNLALGGSYPNSVNKVNMPYFGIPQSTVDKIKRGEVRFQVDWVLVTKNDPGN